MNTRLRSAAAALAACGLLATGAAMAQPAAAPAPSAAPDPALAKAAAAKGAVVTESGLVYQVLAEGKGDSPAATDTVRVHYKGTFTDGREFDSSYSRGQPATFPLNRVIRCWTEGVQKMKVGAKARLTCPSAIAYGERGTPGGPIPPNTVLQFEVELLGITKAVP
jgi:FKBP-type peptidyl-prolyl cis-trans isomerase FkpA